MTVSLASVDMCMRVCVCDILACLTLCLLSVGLAAVCTDLCMRLLCWACGVAHVSAHCVSFSVACTLCLSVSV